MRLRMGRLICVAVAVILAASLVNCTGGHRPHPPLRITSTPVTTAQVGASYTYDVDATSPGSGRTLTYSLVTSPSGMTIDAASGLITWTPASAGRFSASVKVTDRRRSASQSFTVTVAAAAANRAPQVSAGTAQTITLPDNAALDGTVSDDGLPTGGNVTTAWAKSSGPGAVTFGNASVADTTAAFSEAGTYVLRLTASDGLLSASDEVSVTVAPANRAPQVSAGSDQTITLPATADLHGTVGDDRLPAGSTLTSSWAKQSGPGDVTFGNGSAADTTATFSEPGTYVLRLTATDGVLSASDELAVTVKPSEGGGGPPPTSELNAPPIDQTVVTTLDVATAFLYTGADPVQTGVAQGTIDPVRVAVILGRVLDKQNKPLLGVTIRILNHDEFGHAESRVDGKFDMAVNGGGQIILQYTKDGFLPVQRQLNTPWQDYVMAEDVVLIEQDPSVTTVDLTNTTEAFQVARGSDVNDSDGSRQATLLIPRGTQAQVYNPDGTTRAVTALNLRLTEYTVGPNGPAAMPAELPPSSAYTYALELKAEEGQIKRNGKDVLFDRPVPFYVDNFLNFPVGTDVPVGYYDQDKGIWVPSSNGRVIKILTVGNGSVEIDSDGDQSADDAAKLAGLGVNSDERAKLANLYTAGKTLWRVQVDHLSTYDTNWGKYPPTDAMAANTAAPHSDPVVECPETRTGSIIECENQSLRESLPIVGTNLTLNYASNRVAGRKAKYTLTIPVSGAQLPASLKGIDLQIDVAGSHFERSLAAQPNQNHSFTWDGLDGYGRAVVGAAATVRIGYTYDAVYQATDRFGYNGNGTVITGSRARSELTLWKEHAPIRLGIFGAEQIGPAGWSLSVHHAYDPIGKTLYLGTGESRRVDVVGSAVINTVADKQGQNLPLNGPRNVVLGPDGSLYIADTGNFRIRRVSPDGVVTTVAGDGINVDSNLATAKSISSPYGIALGPDGTLYFAELTKHRVRRVEPDGSITVVAGNGGFNGPNGDGGPATSAIVASPDGIALGLDGSLYIAEHGTGRIRRVGPDGIISTVAGGGTGGDGGVATDASLNDPRGVAVGPDGSLYIAETGGHRIRRVDPAGIITTAAGNGNQRGSNEPLQDGSRAIDVSLNSPYGVTVDPDGNLYFSEYQSQRIRRVASDGTIATVAGDGTWQQFKGDRGPATAASLRSPLGVAVGPDGGLYIADSAHNRIRRVASALPGYTASELAIPSVDGTELYKFNSVGQHRQTDSTLTGKPLWKFVYDAGLLKSVTDVDGNVTRITRDAANNTITITAPFLQRTILTLDGNGHLASVTNPAGEAYGMIYTNDGLLTEFTDPKSNKSHLTYDALGRLDLDTDAVGGIMDPERADGDRQYTVELTTARGRTTSYLVEDQASGNQRRLTTEPDSTKAETTIRTDGSTTTTLADGTTIDLLQGPDLRFSMQAPIPATLTVKTGGKTSSVTTTRVPSLGNPEDPLTLTTQTDTVTVNGRIFRNNYSFSNKTVESTSSEGRKTKATINDLGRVVRSEVPGILPVDITYDSYGRLDKITQGTGADQRVVGFAYNAQGYLDTLTDPLGRPVSFQYDGAGRVKLQTLPDGREIGYGYDANGNLASLTPPGRPAHLFSFTARDQTHDYQPPPVPGTGNTTYDYDLDRALTKITRPDGKTLVFDYNDSTGQLDTLTLPGGQIGYGYDSATGKLKDITAQDATLTYTYNGALLTKTVWSGGVTGTLERDYDNDFRVTSLRVNGANPVTFAYDGDGLLKQAGALTLSPSPQNGLLTGTSLGNVTDTYAYTPFGEVDVYEAKYNTTSLLRFEYDYDKLGRITLKKEIKGGASRIFEYGYDIAGRLKEVKRDGVVISSYGYDTNGNRTHLNGALVAHYDDQDRLIDYQGATYQYTANGELRTKTTGGVTTYQYDVLGNLKSVALPDGRHIEYLVDGQNRRIGKKVNGTLVQAFLYQGQLRPIAELDGSGNVVSRFVYGNGVNIPDYMIKGGVTYRIIKDHLGGPRLVVDVATNTVAQEMEYDAFGLVTTDTSPSFQPFGFAGGLHDSDTKLVRFGARDYDAEVALWTAKDPVHFVGGGTNFYMYAAHSPTNLVDPTGLSTLVLYGDPRVLYFNPDQTSPWLLNNSNRQSFESALANYVVASGATSDSIRNVTVVPVDPNGFSFGLWRTDPRGRRWDNVIYFGHGAAFALQPYDRYIDAESFARWFGGRGPRKLRIIACEAGGPEAKFRWRLQDYFPFTDISGRPGLIAPEFFVGPEGQILRIDVQ